MTRLRFAEFRLRLRHELTNLMTLWRMNFAYIKQTVVNYDRQQARQHLQLVRSKVGIYTLRHTATLAIVTALYLALYNRWSYSGDFAVLLLTLCGTTCLAFGYVLSLFYSSFRDLPRALTRLWIGCFLGIVSFTEFAGLSDSSVETVANLILIVSCAVKLLWNLLQYFLQPQREEALLNQGELLELVGFSAAALVISQTDNIAILILIVAFTVTIAAIRLRSFFGFINVGLLAIISGLFFFPSLRVHLLINPFALCSFVARLLMKPLIEYFFSPQSTLDRWLVFMRSSVLLRHFSVMVLCVLEMFYILKCALSVPDHQEWYIVVLMFAASACFWVCYHALFIVTLWQLMKKITNCNMTFRYANEESKNMAQIMASKGIRHFSLISKRVTVVALLSTLLVALVSWETRNALTLSLLVLVLPIEGMVLSLFRTMGTVLGGRCIAYAMVAPAIMQQRRDGAVSLLNESLVMESGGRSLFVISMLEKFFSHHMIHIFGCDYSSSGLTMETVQTKLRAFFQKNTDDGPRYDTYLVYYSGHTHDNGDWALAGNAMLQLETLLSWWEEKNLDTGARLILLLDTQHSYKWLRPVSKTKGSIVGLQTYFVNSRLGGGGVRSVSLDIEGTNGGMVHMGDFTRDFVLFNCSSPSTGSVTDMHGSNDLVDIISTNADPMRTGRIDWSDPQRLIIPAYSVSRAWTNFTFHLPTDQDIMQHWNSNFPAFMQSLIKCMTCACVADCSVLVCCDCVVRCMRRKRMIWFPPKTLDTRHGFSLVRQ